MSDGMHAWLLISGITIGLIILASFLESLGSVIITDNNKNGTLKNEHR